MKYFIITGTSRGLGEAIAYKLISPDHHLICMSRKINESLMAKSSNMDYLEFDLNNVEQVDAMMEKAFSKMDKATIEGVYLINNAAVISPLSRVEQGSVQEFKHNLTVNLLAPMLLTSLFIRFSEELQVEKRVLNISSSSAKHHLPGMSAYSASKAGLDVFTKCVGVEQGNHPFAVKVVSVWPGMIDTCLQEEARNTKIETFASAEIFKMVKDRGMLATPAAAAEQLVNLLLRDQFIQGTVVEEL